MSQAQQNYDALKSFAKEQGADLFGVANIASEYEKFSEEIRHQAAHLPFAIVVAVRLSKAVVETIEDRPTNIYKTHYRAANFLLDNITFKLSGKINDMGNNSIPVAASFIIDWEKQTADVSHKDLAKLAGIGWRGRNNLIVNPDFGPAIRLASVLTDIPLRVDMPLDFGCGKCFICVESCPAGAIKDDLADFDHHACFKKLTEFAHHKSFGQYICGICIKNCPLTNG